MIEIKFILNNGKFPTEVFTTITFNKYRLTSEYPNTEGRIYYDAFLTDRNISISPADWCIITNTYDGEEYYEQCKKVTVEGNREIFYGMEGTRCLLIDALKIVGTTNTLFKNVKHIIVDEEMLREYYSKPLSFMEEDLLE